MCGRSALRFEVLNMLLGQKSQFTKYPCFMCERDSRYRINHWIKRDWPLRESLTTGYRNISHPVLVDKSNVILPPIYTNLGLMKQFVKALNKDACSKYIQEKFPCMSAEKVKESVLVGPQTRKLTKDAQYLSIYHHRCGKKAELSFAEVVLKFLGNTKDSDY